MYDLFTAFISIIVGLITILFRKQITILNKKLVSRYDNFVSRAIINYPIKDAHFMAIFTGAVFIVIGLLEFFRFYHGI